VLNLDDGARLSVRDAFTRVDRIVTRAGLKREIFKFGHGNFLIRVIE
jgi:hypothetical protein